MDWTDAAIEEYKTLRQESLESIRAQTFILQFALASLLVLLGVAVRSGARTPLGLTELLAASPVLTFFLVTLWLSELRRMTGVGIHLAGLERRINAAVGGTKALTWEGSRGRLTVRPGVTRHQATVWLLILVSTAEVIIGSVAAGHICSAELLLGLPGLTLLAAVGLWFGRVDRQLRAEALKARPANDAN
jgi:hypothetical protein